MVRVAMLAVGVGVVLLAGCTPAAKRTEGRAAFDAGYSAFEAGQWQRAIDQFNRYLRADPQTPTRGEVYYYRGECQIRLKRPRDAQADFERAIGAKARPPIDSFARAALGNLFYEEGNDVQAVEHYAEVIKNPPKELPLDRVLLRLAVSLQRLGKWALADKYLAHLMDRYPTSPSVTEAKRRLHADGFTVQVGAYMNTSAAASEAEHLRQAGFVSRIGKASRGSQTLTTVQVGQCRTYGDAAALAQQLSQAGFTTAIVP